MENSARGGSRGGAPRGAPRGGRGGSRGGARPAGGPPRTAPKPTPTTTTTADAEPASTPKPAPAAPAPKADDTTVKQHRLHIGGFRDSVAASDFATRFRSFGTISDVAIPQSETGVPRGFAHFTLAGTDAQVQKLLNTYNGSKWKGGVIHLHPARESYEARLAAERAASAAKEARRAVNFPQKPRDPFPLDGWAEWQRKRIAERKREARGTLAGAEKRTISQVMHDDMQLDGKGEHKWWKRARFGRVLPVMRRLRTPLGPITMDPTRLRDTFERLYLNARNKPVAQLTWVIRDRDRDYGGDGFDRGYDQRDHGDYFDSRAESDWRAQQQQQQSKRHHEGPVGYHHDEEQYYEEAEHYDEGDQYGEEAEEEEETPDTQYHKAYEHVEIESAPTSSSDDNDEEEDDESDAMSVDEPAPAAPAPAPAATDAMDLFSDDDGEAESPASVEKSAADAGSEDEDADRFEFKEQFMGPKGKQLMALQKKAGGDDRFQFTADFATAADEDEQPRSDADGEGESDAESDAGDESRDADGDALDPDDENAARNVRKERSMAMDVLAGMFGEEVTKRDVSKSAPNTGAAKGTTRAEAAQADRTFELTGMSFYDPDAANADRFEVKPVEPEPPAVAAAGSDASDSESSSDEEDSDADDSSSSSDDEAEAKQKPEVATPSFLDGLFGSTAESASAAAPTFSKSGSMINTDFATMFGKTGPAAESKSSFSLFGSSTTTTTATASDSDAKPFFATVAAKSTAAPASAKSGRTATLASTLFFVGDRLGALETKAFVRTQTDAQVKETWAARRWDLHAELKKRHKNAARKARMRSSQHRGGVAVGGGGRRS
ncbi:hypothetical protein H9P43_009455 [Blastocladiella emersonii ATCC 22665]|nr:hypothetical protein H9P43_009436 [Blastocladiella emersonii ATCC 22665]KAI9152659.1 hypothetical protein H9P43_009455 [Blastocladiella emersonii ATCC 22665]